MNVEEQIKLILSKKFAQRQVESSLQHFADAARRYQDADWEGSILKVGKFVEAVMKMLSLYCGQPLPPARKFKVGATFTMLGQLSGYPDNIRIQIPKACVFIYDIASNRGARHDPDEIEPNKMDASVVMPTAAWIFAELVRFADAASSTPENTMMLVETLTEKRYPYFENINGRIYINFKNISPREVGLLILNVVYPKRKLREELIQELKRHGYKDNPIAIAMTRLKTVIDDQGGHWKLRKVGREEAEKILTRNNKIVGK